MDAAQLNIGDMVLAATEIRNDGGIPDLPENALIASDGTRGVVVNRGHLEEQPDRMLLLVRFENEEGVLGPPTGCWPEELRVEQP